MDTNLFRTRPCCGAVGEGMTPLPEPTEITDIDWCVNSVYFPSDMQAYGEAMRREALEEAAKVCFEAEEPDDEYVSLRHTIAKTIRSLK